MPDDKMTLIDFRPDESESDDHPADAGSSQSSSPTSPTRPTIPWVLVLIFLGMAVLAGGLLLSTTLPA